MNYELLTTCQAKIGPKIKKAQNLLKFGSFDISNIPISILISKIMFIKYFYQISIDSEHFSLWDQFGPNNW